MRSAAHRCRAQNFSDQQLTLWKLNTLIVPDPAHGVKAAGNGTIAAVRGWQSGRSPHDCCASSMRIKVEWIGSLRARRGRTTWRSTQSAAHRVRRTRHGSHGSPSDRTYRPPSASRRTPSETSAVSTRSQALAPMLHRRHACSRVSAIPGISRYSAATRNGSSRRVLQFRRSRVYGLWIHRREAARAATAVATTVAPIVNHMWRPIEGN
jgi:hypothetical protein